MKDEPGVMWDGSGDYIDGTFKINGNAVDDTGADFIRKTIDGKKVYSYVIKNEDLNPANKGKLVVNLSTRIDFNGNFVDIYDTKSYRNDVTFVKKSASGRFDGIDGGYYSAVGSVSLSQLARKYGEIDHTGKKITWRIVLNPDNYDLGDVTVSDDLTKDVMGRVPQTFKNAYFWRVNNGSGSTPIEPVIPVISGENHKFIIPDVKEKIYLIIETEIEPGNYSVEFDNYAYIWWNGDESKKVKVYAHVSNINSGATNREA